MNKLIEYVDVNSNEYNIDIKKIRYIVENEKDTYIYPNNGRYAIFNIYPELENLGTELFGEPMYTKVQALYPPEMVKHVDQRDVAWNYIIDPGGDDVYTCFYDNNLNLIEKQKIEPFKWHKLDVTVLHNVIGMTRTRISITVYPTKRINYVEPVVHVNYNWNEDLLKNEFNRLWNEKDPDFEFYKNGEVKKNTIPGLRVLGSQKHGENTNTLLMQEAKKFIDYYNIKDDFLALFMWMDKDFYLPWHIDDKKLCNSSVNLVLTDKLVPVEFRGSEYDYRGKFTYKCAAVDVMTEHSVQNSDSERILFRISFKNLSHKELVNDYLRKRN